MCLRQRRTGLALLLRCRRPSELYSECDDIVGAGFGARLEASGEAAVPTVCSEEK